MRRLAGVLALSAFLAGCISAPQSRGPAAVYDLGPLPIHENSKCINATLLIPNIAAPSWLDSPDITYRLDYDNKTRHHAYADSRWVAAPAALLSQRLRQRIAAANEKGVLDSRDGAQADYLVRMELQEFTQVFYSEKCSYVAIGLRASVIRLPDRKLIAQRSFLLRREAPSPNAEGAVKGLVDASDSLISELIDWVSRNLATQN
ncbi:MAG TPA: ABC-type transport auxiliary lipoprotein family protein [Burkholderiales bacterium]|nr:ABC-type transport auxiliary lipoprotein family protein [Burkholderiales bacterium]